MIKDFYKQIIEQIPSNSNLAIWGTSDVAVCFKQYINELRKDVNIKFFISSYKFENSIDDKIISSLDFVEHSNEVDSVIITSYSGKIFIENILKLLKIKNIFYINEDFLKKEEIYNPEETKKVFKDEKDKQLFELISNYRANINAYKKDLERYYVLNHPLSVAGYAKNHYFDFIKKDKIETVIDAGGFDCFQSLLFLNEFPKCKKVYTFEPCYKTFKKPFYDSIIKKRKEIDIIEKGLWSKTDILEFRKENDVLGGSAITDVKPALHESYDIIKIPVIFIDDFVIENNIKKIDFIKMDIENAEKNAIIGGLKTILRDRPQMAISIYHSQEQFYELPIFLKETLENYSFHLEHYSNGWCETVLYAIPNDLL